MAEEKIVRINIQKDLVKVPRWKRQSKVIAILKRRLKIEDLKIDQKLNEKVFSGNIHKFKIKITKDDKTTTAKLAE